MIVATRDDYEYPHIDWLCKECGEVYCSAGHPPETRCTNGHAHGWKPEPDQVEAYIDVLESLEQGDGIVICGDGPIPQMGPVESTGDGTLVTKSIEHARRELRWRDSDHEDGPVVEWVLPDNDHAIFRDVYHVETVAVQTEKSENTEVTA
jgi:hypothetical protein